jgi:protein associated with RNAse G/E
MTDDITIHKLDHIGHETWDYSGKIIERGETWVQLEAFFNRPDSDAGYVVFRQGDRFVEWFYTDRWYNIFEIHDVDDDRIKGWYCNLTYPAQIKDHDILNRDLALDVWVDPHGEIQMLDEDEFAALPIDSETRGNVLLALDDLRGRIERREDQFAEIQQHASQS